MEQKKWWNVTYTKSGDFTVLAATERDAIEAADKLWAEGKRPEWTPSEISDARPVDEDEQVDAWKRSIGDAIDDKLNKSVVDIDALFYPIIDHFRLDVDELSVKAYVTDLIGMWSEFDDRIYAKHARRLMATFTDIIVYHHVYGEDRMLGDYKSELVANDYIGDIAEAACAIDMTSAADGICHLVRNLVRLVAAISLPRDDYENALVAAAHEKVDAIYTAGEATKHVQLDGAPIIPIRLMNAIAEHRSSARR